MCAHTKQTHTDSQSLNSDLTSLTKKNPFFYKNKKVEKERGIQHAAKSSGATNFSPQFLTWRKKVPAKPRSERSVWRLNTNSRCNRAARGVRQKEGNFLGRKK